MFHGHSNKYPYQWFYFKWREMHTENHWRWSNKWKILTLFHFWSLTTLTFSPIVLTLIFPLLTLIFSNVSLLVQNEQNSLTCYMVKFGENFTKWGYFKYFGLNIEWMIFKVKGPKEDNFLNLRALEVEKNKFMQHRWKYYYSQWIKSSQVE